MQDIPPLIQFNTLYVTLHPHQQYGGLWKPDSEGQENVFKHFTGSSIAISFDRLAELISVAELHGWKVVTTEAPTNNTKTLLQQIIKVDPSASIDLCWLVDNVGTATKAWQEIEKAYAEQVAENKNK